MQQRLSYRKFGGTVWNTPQTLLIADTATTTRGMQSANAETQPSN